MLVDTRNEASCLIDLLVKRLSEQVGLLNTQFLESKNEVGIKYCFIDDLLPTDLAMSIYEKFPGCDEMRLMKSFREIKYTSKNFDAFNPLLRGITFAFQDPKVVSIVEEITGIKNQLPDERLYAGGLSSMSKGHFLGPHIDNSHDGDRVNFRTLNLLYYVSPDWCRENGGNLELWDRAVARHVTVDSKFNRLVIMETNPWSWHSVSEILVDRRRCCISNYYFSPTSPIGDDYFNVTSFSARPEQYFWRSMCWIDNKIRQSVRLVVPRGMGKKDIYKGRRR
jgi:Rps23 Pro-64 3,4-dihydroxylase Tpa1-like proline 4-hydroxylase